jgi:hypothetical protein
VNPGRAPAWPEAAGRRIVSNPYECELTVVRNVRQRAVCAPETVEAELREGGAAHRQSDHEGNRCPGGRVTAVCPHDRSMIAHRFTMADESTNLRIAIVLSAA